MALAASVDDLDDVPEPLREHYVQRGSKWILETEGDEAKLRLNRDLAAERKRRQDLEKDLKRYNGMTPEEVEALRGKRRRDDDEEETSSQRVQRLRDELDRTKRESDVTLREREADMARLKAELSQERIGARLRSTAGLRGLPAGAQEDAVLLGLRVWREDETGKVAAFDANGERALGKSGDDLTMDEWLEQRRVDKAHWFGGQTGTGNQGGGASHQASPPTSRVRPRRRSEMTVQEKASLISEIGQAAYLDLPN